MSSYVYGVVEAVDILQRETAEIEELTVYFENIPIVETGLRQFGQFATAFELNQHVEQLCLHGGVFDHPIDALDRLFGTILPIHPSMTRIMLARCVIMPKYIEIFANSFTNATIRGTLWPLWGLESIDFIATPLDLQGALALANLIRANTRLERLFLYACDLKSDGCQAILESTGGNTHLRDLWLYQNEISEVSVMAVKALARSNVRRLDLSDNILTTQSIQNVVEGLRTNFSLEFVDVKTREREEPPFPAEFFEDLLTTFNFTLQYLSPCPPAQHRVDELLRRNEHVRNVHNVLMSQSYFLPQLPLWPLALSRIKCKPSLLYHFVRKGNLDSFIKHVTSSECKCK